MMILNLRVVVDSNAMPDELEFALRKAAQLAGMNIMLEGAPARGEIKFLDIAAYVACGVVAELTGDDGATP
jgi:hypothetical protein